MSESKSDKKGLLLYVHSGKLTKILYHSAAFIMLIAMTISAISNNGIDDFFRKTMLGIAGVLFVIGRSLVILNKKKENINILIDLFTLAMIIYVFINSVINN